MPYLYEKKFRPKLEKRGHKVTQISTNIGVSFRDMVKLLAPGTNLRNFGKLFNLEQTKAFFPFQILDSVEVLKRESLPNDVRSWHSDLSTDDSQIGPEQIAEAQRLFKDSSCKNIGDYLATYLKLDVDILYKACQEWRRQLKKLINIDFVEASKFTISSLSYTAGLKFAEKNCRIGTFFPNNSQNYRLLRKGMRGYLHFYFLVFYLLKRTSNYFFAFK